MEYGSRTKNSPTVPEADEKSDIEWGRQFGKLEKGVKETGVDYILVSLPQFVENWYMWAPTIKNDDKIFWPCDPDSKASFVSCKDIADFVGMQKLHSSFLKDSKYAKVMRLWILSFL